MSVSVCKPHVEVIQETRIGGNTAKRLVSYGTWLNSVPEKSSRESWAVCVHIYVHILPIYVAYVFSGACACCIRCMLHQVHAASGASRGSTTGAIDDDADSNQ